MTTFVCISFFQPIFVLCMLIYVAYINEKSQDNYDQFPCASFAEICSTTLRGDLGKVSITAKLTFICKVATNYVTISDIQQKNFTIFLKTIRSKHYIQYITP